MDSGFVGHTVVMALSDVVVFITMDSDSHAAIFSIVTTDNGVLGEGVAELDVTAVKMVPVITDVDGVDIDSSMEAISAAGVHCGLGGVTTFNGTRLELTVVVMVFVCAHGGAGVTTFNGTRMELTVVGTVGCSVATFSISLSLSSTGTDLCNTRPPP